MDQTYFWNIRHQSCIMEGGDLQLYFSCFEKVMISLKVYQYHWPKLFTATLRGRAQEWSSNLAIPRDLIWENLAREFIDHFSEFKLPLVVGVTIKDLDPDGVLIEKEV